MAQAVQSRDSTRTGRRWPRLKLKIDPVRAGACLGLFAWLLQAYAGTWFDARDRLARSIESAETQRELWLIEYNSSLVRPLGQRNSRVTARAAYQVVCNTHKVLAFSEIAHGGLLTRSDPILDTLQEKQDWARKLFDASDYRQLVEELNTVSKQFEERSREHTLGVPSRTGVVAWWQHIPPILFLVGMMLCVRGRRSTPDSE